MLRRLARALLRLYPGPWRDRYGAEVDAILEGRHVRGADLWDLLRGAGDAWLRPQVLAPPMLVAAAPLPVSLPSPPTPSYGIVTREPPIRDVTRRAFMRRMLGMGVGLLSLEFLGGTLAYLWPTFTEGLGSVVRVGTVSDILSQTGGWTKGWPHHVVDIRTFLINVPAAKALASGDDLTVSEPSAGELLALWRKCPHLGCMVPPLCAERKRFECRCHGSTYNIIGEKLIRGPAERGMARFPVAFDDDVITIDTREVISGPPTGVVTFHDPYPDNEFEGCGSGA